MKKKHYIVSMMAVSFYTFWELAIFMVPYKQIIKKRNMRVLR